MKNYFLFCLLLFILIGCSFGDVPVTCKSFDGTYSLDLPIGYEENKSLNMDATFAFSDLENEVYIIVIAEEKAIFKKTLNYYGLQDVFSNNLEDYSEVCQLNYKKNEEISVFKFSDREEVNIGSMNGLMVEMYGRVNGLDIAYHVTYVEGKSSYYQILSWTLADRYEKNLPVFKKIHASFKEL